MGPKPKTHHHYQNLSMSIDDCIGKIECLINVVHGVVEKICSVEGATNIVARSMERMALTKMSGNQKNI